MTARDTPSKRFLCVEDDGETRCYQQCHSCEDTERRERTGKPPEDSPSATSSGDAAGLGEVLRRILLSLASDRCYACGWPIRGTDHGCAPFNCSMRYGESCKNLAEKEGWHQRATEMADVLRSFTAISSPYTVCMRSETPRKYGFEKAHAVCILLCRDALLRKDYEGAYHWLYTLDSKQVPHDPFKPWAELEALAGEDYKPCKAVSYAPNGGASQEQRWHCEECGDVTDTDRCPKGRQNETLAKLASAPSPLAPSTQEKP